jgi:uncharacterized protein (DUF433 family)
MTTATGHPYIVNDDQILGGEPIIRGTRTPVRAIVETWRLGVPAEEIPNALPHLTLAQVFDALSFYSDHQDEINAYIEQNRIPATQIDPLHAGNGSERAQSEFGWLAENRQRYAGRWIALEGDKLLAVGDSVREVYAALANHAGTPLVTQVEPEDEHHFAGW